ncbi:hypothetical protein L208DRAFT_1381361 [Tricholoma matsutake]|nr:hypothetical protein L208DRAFT_1381361 [Tricholoma matsutake 945]
MSKDSTAYDPLNRRLAVASHSGQMKLFNIEQCVNLVLVWTASIGNVIPRGLAFFGGANQSLLTLGLEMGEMSCRDAQNSNVLWTKTLAGGVRFTKQCVFMEGGKVAICGSDNSRVQVVDVFSGECLQSLPLGTGQERELIQAIASTALDGGWFLIAGGSSSGIPGISLWEKKLPGVIKANQESTSSAEPELEFVAWISVILAHGVNILATLSGAH